MHRRTFLCSLGLAAAGMALDPELALWVPGRKTYFDLPPAAPNAESFAWIKVGDIISFGDDPKQYLVTCVDGANTLVTFAPHVPPRHKVAPSSFKWSPPVGASMQHRRMYGRA